MAYTIVLSTCPTRESAEKIARLLVEERLAACVQRLPIESTYLWQGKVCNSAEVALLIKTKTEHFKKVSARILELHEYELPEIIQIPITDGLPDYLRWIDDCTP